MNVPDLNKLSEAMPRRELTPTEEAQLQEYLRAKPDQREFWEDELGLNHLLSQLPDTPVSSNFSLRVLQAAQDEELQRTRLSFWGRLWVGLHARAPRQSSHDSALGGMLFGRWLPKLAVLTLMLGLAMVGYQHHQATTRKQLAVAAAEIGKLPPDQMMDLLENFDAIQRLNQVPSDSGHQLKADKELLAALQ
jgi:hypothetical protein